MRNKIVRRKTLLSLILLVSCGGGKDEEEFKFYALKEAASQQLELTVEASGTVEAISSIEIKSKASGQILFLGAEIGDYVDIWTNVVIKEGIKIGNNAVIGSCSFVDVDVPKNS